MSNFTPAPWVADEYRGCVFAHGADMMICQLRGAGYLRRQGLPDEEIVAIQDTNARLIAAAPKMYELLKVCVNIQAQPILMNAQGKAKELLARIDGEVPSNE